MRTENTILEVSEILASFDLDVIQVMVEKQIKPKEDGDNFGNAVMDLFKPLYLMYEHAITSPNPDVVEMAKSRFTDICHIFINAICKKYHIVLDEEWYTKNFNNLHTVAIILYSFFVLEIRYNICFVCTNYIIKNIKTLETTFETEKSKKDASTLHYKKIVKPEYAGIIANIYDVISWILEIMNVDTFFEYMEKEYYPYVVLKRLYDEEKISGDFVEVFSTIYNSNLQVKSAICYDIADRLSKQYAISDTEKIQGGLNDE